MRKTINQNKTEKGTSDVKSKSTRTILKTVNMLDVSCAGVARSGKGRWDDFELMGTSNKHEGEYMIPDNASLDIDAVMLRVKKATVGKKILKLHLPCLETA